MERKTIIHTNFKKFLLEKLKGKVQDKIENEVQDDSTELNYIYDYGVDWDELMAEHNKLQQKLKQLKND